MRAWAPLTIADCYQAVVLGSSLWTGFGTFLDDWRWLCDNDPSRRSRVLEGEIRVNVGLEREAAFLQAVAEHLMVHHDMDIGARWITDPRWVLPDPWFLYPGYRLRAWQLVTTPAAFKARNIFGGDQIFHRA